MWCCRKMWKLLRHKFLPIVRLPKTRQELTVLFCFCLGVSTLFYAGTRIPERIAFSKTGSLSHRFFFFKDRFAPDELTTGTYIITSIDSDIVAECRPCRVVKQIGCDEGDRLSVTGEGYFYCNESYLGFAKTHSKKGIAVEHFTYNGLVPEGKFFAVGSCPDSFDSRYIGFLNKVDVEAIAIPLF